MNLTNLIFMKTIAGPSFKFQILLLFFIAFSTSVIAQTTYKVVCDKTDKTVKIVETSKRSANYVPIKAGFPFRQVAQKWIDENYSTTYCDPGQIIKQNNAQQNQPAPTLNNTATNQPSPTPSHTILQPRRSGANSAVNYKNTSFLMNVRFSNLGEAFRLSEKLMPGFEAGIEQVFGKQFYFGTGINMDFYFSDFDGDYDISTESIYFFKIPAFVGIRKATKNMMVMYEAGAAVNTGFVGTPLILESFGKTANKNSFDFLARMKVGSEKVLLEFGTDIWLTEIFENDSFKMSSVYVGLRFNF